MEIKYIMIIALVLLVGCTNPTEQAFLEDTGSEVEDVEVASDQETAEEDMVPESGWRDVEYKDVLTGETFKISDFKGTPLLVETFAVWCPTCRKQQDKIKELHEEVGDSVISISLDVDVNEDEEKVINHAKANGFDWRYAVSPRAATQSILDEFGVVVVNPPAAPVILVCEDQSARLLPTGVKDASELKEEIERGC